MGVERSAEVMRTYLEEVLGNRRFELIPDFVDQEMLDHATGMRGPDALHTHATGFCDNIPDVEIEMEDIFATEDAAFGIWSWKGRFSRWVLRLMEILCFRAVFSACFGFAMECWWNMRRS